MRTLRRLVLLAFAAAMPAFALAQAEAYREPPPGGASEAWPLGLIVALVVVFALAAMWAALALNRRRREAGRPPSHG